MASTNKIILDNKDDEKLGLASEDDRKTSILGPNLVVPRTIVGPAHMFNKGAVDWGHHGLMAYGCNNTVVVLDTRNVQIIQTLEGHKNIIKKVLWVHGVEPNTDGTGKLQLVSGDLSGQIIHWDVTDGTEIASLPDGNKSIIGMSWVPGHEKDLILAAVYSPYYLVLWSVKTKTKLWKKSFTDTLLSFDFDPFCNSKIAFLCPDSILLVDEFQKNKIPSTNGRKFYVSSGTQWRDQDSLTRGPSQRDRLKKLIRSINVGENKPKTDEGMTLNECKQLVFHRSLRDHLILLYPRDVLIIDLKMNQTLTIVPADKSVSPVTQVWTCRKRDVLYLLHESGAVAVKVRRRCKAPSVDIPSPPQQDSPPHQADYNYYWTDSSTGYEGKCQSDIIRQTKGSKILSLAVDPINEANIGVTMSCGKVVLLQLQRMNPKLSSPFSHTITDILPNPLPQDLSIRVLTWGAVSRMNGSVTVARMAPQGRARTVSGSGTIPLSGGNTLSYPILAVGTSTGYLYLYNLAMASIQKEFSIHSHAVRGVEWVDNNRILTYSYVQISSGGGSRVKNELHMIDIRSGHSIPIRTDRPPENPVHLVRVSPLRQYFVVVIKDGAFELWELTPQIGLLRTFSKRFPSVVALEWSPIYNSKSMSKRKASIDESGGKPEKGKTQENFVFSDSTSQLYHFCVEDDKVKDGIKIPPDASVTMVTCLAFKANQIVQGDSEGILNIWDLKERSNKNENINRGPIRYLRFAPGRNNLKLLALFNDGICIVLLKQPRLEKISQLKGGSRIVDADWASSDLPVIVMEDGTIRVLDLTVRHSSSPLSLYTFRDPVSCPQRLGKSTLDKLQFLLCTQYWKEEPAIEDFSSSDGFTSLEINNVKNEMSLLNIDAVNFSCLKTVEKCVLVSRLLGMPAAIDLWTVAQYYIRQACIKKEAISDSESLACEGSEASEQDRISKALADLEQLDTCYDYLMDASSYQAWEIERTRTDEWRRTDYKQRQSLVDRLLLLGDVDQAVQLLLDSDIDNPSYYTDALKACLVSTIQQSGAAQSTVKLVATNLIANSRIWQGVELLCLMGRGVDGCSYLVASGLWSSAVWLAKATLSSQEIQLIMKRFADHLAQQGDEFAATLVLLSEGLFDKAIEMLLSQDVFSAALMLFSCLEYNLSISSEISERVFRRLKDYLLAMDNTEGAKYVADRAGM